MAEVDNDNLLDYEGLAAYDEQIKNYIDEKINEAINNNQQTNNSSSNNG